MSRLSQPQLNTLQAHVQTAVDHLDSLGLKLRLTEDLLEAVYYLKGQPESRGIPKTHDPRATHIPDGTAFAIFGEDGEGFIRVCHLHRLVDWPDFIDAAQRQTYFFDKGLTFPLAPITFHPDTENIRIGGMLALGAGNHVHPDYRRKGLMLFNRASRSLAMLRWNWDFTIGSALKGREVFLTKAAGYRHCAPFLSGGMPGKPSAQDTILGWSSRDEFLEDIAEELSA